MIYYSHTGETAMTFPLFSRVILVENILDTNLVAGDMGTIVEYHPATKRNTPKGTKWSAGNGETLAVVSVPSTTLRQVTRNDLLHVRHVVAA
jgi:hypothetical protein